MRKACRDELSLRPTCPQLGCAPFGSRRWTSEHRIPWIRLVAASQAFRRQLQRLSRGKVVRELVNTDARGESPPTFYPFQAVDVSCADDNPSCTPRVVMPALVVGSDVGFALSLVAVNLAGDRSELMHGSRKAGKARRRNEIGEIVLHRTADKLAEVDLCMRMKDGPKEAKVHPVNTSA